jgi:type IV pilus assembly protein PilB
MTPAVHALPEAPGGERQPASQAVPGAAGGTPRASGTPEPKRLGELLIDAGLLTSAQLQEALRLQAQLDRYVPLGHILVAQNVVTRRQLLRVMERNRRSAPLGELLVKSGLIGAEELADALREQRRTGRPLGTTLVAANRITEHQLRTTLCMQLHIKFFDLDEIMIDPGLRTLVNPKFAIKHQLVPLARVADTLVVAMDDPTQAFVVDELERGTGLHVEIVTGTSAGIARALARLYTDEIRPRLGVGENVEVIAEDKRARDPQHDHLSPVETFDSADDIVRKLIRVAVDRGASDIHFEMVGDRLKVRFRIDGSLLSLNLGPLDDAISRRRRELVARIKILSKLDIAEHRRPQDGSFRARVESDGRIVPFDFRVSVIPSHYGENAVIRVLDPRSAPDSLEAVGLSEAVTAGLRRLIRSTTGIILVTGPTGSGKSTTLFGLLRSIYRPGIKIVTAENPIEYVCDGFSQHEVNERIGNTFAGYLRSFLRHDPEVIMVGEIRDQETAQLAFRAAQTGHLVLSTLHTNDAVSAITRLRDLGVDTNVCTSSLLGVVAQRLVREVCWNCKEPYTPAADVLHEVFGPSPPALDWYHGVGCPACHYSGYKRRLPLAELWTPSQRDVALINVDASFDEIAASAEKSTLSMAEDAITRLRQGRTSLDELVRALPHSTLRQLQLMPI